jgi:hypothetical protein
VKNKQLARKLQHLVEKSMDDVQFGEFAPLLARIFKSRDRKWVLLQLNKCAEAKITVRIDEPDDIAMDVEPEESDDDDTISLEQPDDQDQADVNVKDWEESDDEDTSPKDQADNQDPADNQDQADEEDTSSKDQADNQDRADVDNEAPEEPSDDKDGSDDVNQPTDFELSYRVRTLLLNTELGMSEIALKTRLSREFGGGDFLKKRGDFIDKVVHQFRLSEEVHPKEPPSAKNDGDSATPEPEPHEKDRQAEDSHVNAPGSNVGGPKEAPSAGNDGDSATPEPKPHEKDSQAEDSHVNAPDSEGGGSDPFDASEHNTGGADGGDSPTPEPKPHETEEGGSRSDQSDQQDSRTEVRRLPSPPVIVRMAINGVLDGEDATEPGTENVPQMMFPGNLIPPGNFKEMMFTGDLDECPDEFTANV